jgi:hypothetical protein
MIPLWQESLTGEAGPRPVLLKNSMLGKACEQTGKSRTHIGCVVGKSVAHNSHVDWRALDKYGPTET